MLARGDPSYVAVGLSDARQVAREPWGSEQSQSPEGEAMGVADVAGMQTCFVGGNVEAPEMEIQEGYT